MAITEVDTSREALCARELRDDITRGLQEPLAEVLRTLQRLAIAQVSADAPQLDSQLLVRGRSLAHGLSQVVEELIATGTQDGVLDSREPHEPRRMMRAAARADWMDKGS